MSGGKLGFGCMRPPMIDGENGTVDQEQFNHMVDRFLEEGFDYFDTAVVYLDGKSEAALREGLVKRYPRERYRLADKLSGSAFQTEADILPLFTRQLAACGVDYFDCYLHHSMGTESYAHHLDCNAFEIVKDLKRQGKIRRIGMSFHDTPEVLEKILTEQPHMEFVQIQFNYLDYADPAIQSKAIYDVCRRFAKPMIIMEPVRGGALANLPPEGADVFAALQGGTPATYAVRFAASFEGVETVLSGMSSTEQMDDNLSAMKAFRPLDERELEAVWKVRDILKTLNAIPCTACRYCVAGCPKHIPIPTVFSCMNSMKQYKDWGSGFYYDIATAEAGKASDCIACGKCETICPQHLPIPQLMKEAADLFDDPSKRLF